jgi:hypothetical protein
MAMAGRKRKPGVRRKPNGQPLYSERIEPTEETKAKRIEAFGDWKARGELNSVVDHLRASLSEEQFWAARIACQTYARYQAALHSPRCVTGQLEDYIQGGGQTEPMDPDSAQKAVKKYCELIRCVQVFSRRGLLELQRIMHGTRPRDIDHLKLALEAIIAYLDLRKQKAA